MSSVAESDRRSTAGALRAEQTPPAPAAGVGARAAETPAGDVRRPRVWWEALTVAWLCWVYDATTNLAPLRLHTALRHARDVLALERSLGIAVEQTLDRWLAAHHTLGLVVSDYYDNAHFIVTLGVLGWLWWRRPDIYRPLRSTLVLVNVIAFVVFWRFPVAPPRMLPGFVDVVASTHAIGSWHAGALASAANQLAAMPSLHIAWAVWCTFAIWRACRRAWVRALATLYPMLTTFAVLATGNHFVMDVLGGLLTCAASLLVVRLLALAPRRSRARIASMLRAPVRPRPSGPAPAVAASGRSDRHKVVTKSPSR